MRLRYAGAERVSFGMCGTYIRRAKTVCTVLRPELRAALSGAGRFASLVIDRGWGKWAMRGSNPRPHGCDPCALAN